MSHQAGRRSQGQRRPPRSGTPLDRFTDELAAQLRRRGQARDEVREVVTDVRRHVLSTGQDPRVAFGPPEQYAAQLVPATPRDARPGIGSDLLWAMTSGLGGFLVASGGVDAVLGSDTFGVPGWVQLVVGVALLAAGAITVATGRPADPGDQRDRATRLAHFAGVALGVALVATVILIGAELITN